MLSLISAFWLATAFEPLRITEGMSVARVTQGGRNPAPEDRLVAELVALPTFSPADSKLPWSVAKANTEGWFEGLASGYLWSTFRAATQRVMVLEATGHGMVYINGEPRAGDPYAAGYLKQPFLARMGENSLLFAGGRGRIKAQISEPKAEAQLDVSDLTMPDVVRGDKGSLFGAVVVLNNTAEPASDLRLSAELGDKSLTVDVPVISPLVSRKVRFNFPVSLEDAAIDLMLFKGGKLIDTTSVSVAVREPSQHYKRTFVSKIDGSVQYYGVAPALKPSPENALVLTLHGAGVEGIGQAQAYAPKEWATTVAATNRRPFGFDWEDWGRIDALEVLGIAESTFRHDPKRVFLTGHSMGGHGTWHLGTMFPDRFGAMAPSAGWISFWSYAGGWEPRQPNAVEKLMRTALNPSDTLARIRNVNDIGVYILHGDTDDNVPVSQARAGRAALRPWHRDLRYHEQPGAGHWWGNECVDWPGIFDMFKSRQRDLNPDRIEFVTQNPGISGKNAWVTIQQADSPEKPSSVRLARNAPVWTRVSIEGTTENVACLSLEIASNASVRLDGQSLGPASAIAGYGSHVLTLRKIHGRWQGTSSRAIQQQKNALRNGPLKQAFQNRMVFAYGTAGTPEENAWAYGKARFDAESFYYRGNGSVDVIADSAAARMALGDRNIILYGNADTNLLWTRFLGSSPIQVSRAGVTMGAKKLEGESFGAMFVRPFGSGKQLVGALAGTGLKGSRILNRMPVFVSGVAYPDWILFDAQVLTAGTKGVFGAGYFGNDWSLRGPEAWR